MSSEGKTPTSDNDGIEIPEDRLLCIVTDQLREDSEHNRNRNQFAEELYEEYGYSIDQMDVEHGVKAGSKSFPIDLVVFEDADDKRRQNIRIATEIEPEDTDPDDPDHGVGQIKSYMAMAACEFGVWYNGVERICFHQPDPGGDVVEINDIPPNGMTLEDIEVPDFGQLIPASELRGEFKRCHNYIAGNQGFQKTEAFHELLKIIFCKVHDERHSDHVRFYVTNTERREMPERCADRIKELFDEVKDANEEIFDENETIQLNADVIAFVTKTLQNYSLIQTDTDVKGEAYEEIVGDNLRGDRGEFFTPRNVTWAAVEMAFHTIPQDEWENMRVIDPACGTGGFLIAVIEFLKQQFYQTELEKWGDEDRAESNTRERVRRFCERNLHGIDINPTLVRATQMNEVMHGDGHQNLFAANSLEEPSNWKDDMRDSIELGSFDLLFANPPFGADIQVDTQRILRQFDIGHTWDADNFRRKSGLRAAAPPEQLFIERSIQFLDDGGKMIMIIPDNILTNPGLSYIRYWLLQHTKLISAVSLPREAFEPFVGTKSHLVMVEKKDSNELAMEDNWEAFMCEVDYIGHNKRGEPIYLQTENGKKRTHQVEKKVMRVEDGEKVIDTKTITEPIILDEMPAAVDRFKRWWDSQ